MPNPVKASLAKPLGDLGLLDIRPPSREHTKPRGEIKRKGTDDAKEPEVLQVKQPMSPRDLTAGPDASKRQRCPSIARPIICGAWPHLVSR